MGARSAAVLLFGLPLAALAGSCTLISWDEYRVAGGGGAAHTSSASSGSGSGSGGAGGEIFPLGPGWPDSATRYCADGAKEVSCPTAPAANFHGQDGDYTLLVPMYTLASVGGGFTIQDSVTGLSWEADFNVVTQAHVTFAGAVTRCQMLRDSVYAGLKTWRLPSRRELASLLDAGRAVPMGHTAGSFFPKELDQLFDDAEQNSAFYWTSIAAVSDPGKAWTYAFVPKTSGVTVSDTGATGRALCVAGPMTYAASAFTANNGIVTDASTSLTWQRGLAPKPMTWTDALAYCDALSINGATFRLPSLKEMLSLVDDGHVNPAIAPAFQGTTGERFWTATPYPGDPTQAWYVDFTLGEAAPEPIGMTTQGVRCVR